MAERVAAALGAAAVATRPVSGGWSTAERLVIELDDGRTVFAKCAHEEPVIGFLRQEHAFYEAVEADFMPELVTFLGDDPPVLVLEDLSGGHWPPPWPPGAVDAVLSTLERVHATPSPAHLERLADQREGFTDCWATVAVDPDPFLSLGVCSREWLEAALPVLDDASQRAQVDGSDLLHLDVRSDNICLLGPGAAGGADLQAAKVAPSWPSETIGRHARGKPAPPERTVLVDWNWACVGNGIVEIAFWVPSLHREGGPEPQVVLPDCPPAIVAMVAGFFASRAGLPPPATAPQVRRIQLAQLEVVLPWAAQFLGLPAPS